MCIRDRAIADILPGDVLTEQNIWVKRPGGGDFSVNDYESLLGKVAVASINKGFQLKLSDLDLR